MQVRLGLYRRLSGLRESADLENFSAELADRFGALPEEVKHLLTVVQIKNYCRRAGISQVDAGPKGAVIAFRNKRFANPQGLVKFMHDNGAAVKLQPDHKLVFRAEWDDGVERLRGARALVRELADVAEHKEPALPQTVSGRGHAAAQYRQAEAAGARSAQRKPTRRSCRPRSNTPRAGLANSGAERAVSSAPVIPAYFPTACSIGEMDSRLRGMTPWGLPEGCCFNFFRTLPRE